jgi:hypothetical protein
VREEFEGSTGIVGALSLTCTIADLGSARDYIGDIYGNLFLIQSKYYVFVFIRIMTYLSALILDVMVKVVIVTISMVYRLLVTHCALP